VPDDGLLSKLIRKNLEEKSGLTEEELISIGIFLFTAGEETSAGLISNALLQFYSHAEQLRALRAHPELLESAIEEVLRFDSVVQLLGRVAKEDVIIRGKVIPAGAAVTLVVASGNRDEDAFESPERFDITRKPNRHLSFGSGIHYCLGDWLGRKQSQIALRAFLDRFDEIRIPQQELRWYKNIAVRRLSGLSVSCR
jgi:cytochrome P450